MKFDLTDIKDFRDESEHGRLITRNILQKWGEINKPPPNEVVALKRQRLETQNRMVQYFEALVKKLERKDEGQSDDKSPG